MKTGDLIKVLSTNRNGGARYGDAGDLGICIIPYNSDSVSYKPLSHLKSLPFYPDIYKDQIEVLE